MKIFKNVMKILLWVLMALLIGYMVFIGGKV